MQHTKRKTSDSRRKDDDVEKKKERDGASASGKKNTKVKKLKTDDAKNQATGGLQSIATALAEKKARELLAMMKDGVMIRLLATDSFYTALAVGLYSLHSLETLTFASLQTLRDSGILSAPIYDEAEGKYVGLIDLVDLTAITLEILESNETFKKKKKVYQEKAKKHEHVEDETEDDDEANLISEHLLMESLSVKQLSG